MAGRRGDLHPQGVPRRHRDAGCRHRQPAARPRPGARARPALRRPLRPDRRLGHPVHPAAGQGRAAHRVRGERGSGRQGARRPDEQGMGPPALLPGGQHLEPYLHRAGRRAGRTLAGPAAAHRPRPGPGRLRRAARGRRCGHAGPRPPRAGRTCSRARARHGHRCLGTRLRRVPPAGNRRRRLTRFVRRTAGRARPRSGRPAMSGCGCSGCGTASAPPPPSATHPRWCR